MSTRSRKYTVDEIVAAALDLTAKHGFAGVTMRSVAQELGASAMSLYRYVADRDELIHRVADASLAGLELPPPPADGEIAAWLRAVLDDARLRMLRYPGVADHLLLHGPTGPYTLAFMADVCAAIRLTGRNAEQTAWTYDWLMTTAAAYVSKETQIASNDRRTQLVEALGERASSYLAHRRDLAEVVGSFNRDMETAFRRATDAVIAAIVGAPGNATEFAAI